MRLLQRNILVLFVSFTAICSVAMGQGNGPAAPPPPGGDPRSIFVPLAPCRILDTQRDRAPNAPPQASRHVDIRSTRCGQIIPPYATAFALKTISFSQTAPETLPPGLGRVENRTTLPAQADGGLDFSVPPNASLAVDVYGYYVAPGTPVGPTSASTGAGGSVTAASTSTTSTMPRISRSHPGALDVIPGNKGQIYLDASVAPFSQTGVLMTTPNSAYPWIVAKVGTPDAGSGFCVFNSSNSELVVARGDGAVQLINGAFLDGRTDYFGSSGSYYGFVATPTNIVHDVTLVDPRDSAGGATNRVVFYNAQTDDEYGSPATTKFRASTLGYYSHPDINFDSQITYSWPGTQEYYYRAYSAYEGREVFWLKPNTNSDSITNTRADMYVSGLVGIGTTTPAALLTSVRAPTRPGSILPARMPHLPRYSLCKARQRLWTPGSVPSISRTVLAAS